MYVLSAQLVLKRVLNAVVTLRSQTGVVSGQRLHFNAFLCKLVTYHLPRIKSSHSVMNKTGIMLKLIILLSE